MKAQLTITYEFSRDDDFGWLQAKVATTKVSGKFGFWVRWQCVEEWASELAAFPMRGGARSEVDWGLSDSDGTNYQPIVKVVISSGKTGNLETLVQLSDQVDARVHCQALFNTDFPALQRFAEELGRLMRRDGAEASLTGTNVG